jgi:hypothetical protein
VRYPWANVALIILLIIQLVTGYFGFINGREARRWILWLHGIGAYAVVLLLFWKSSIIFDAWRRKKTWTRRRIGFVVLLVLLLLTLALGLLWTFYGPLYWGGFSLVSLHIYVAIPLMVLLLWHAWHMRFILRVPHTLGRRLFLSTALTSVAGLVLWRSLRQVKTVFALPGAAQRFTGSYETGSFTGLFPHVSWIADRPAPVDPAAWRLAIEGLVARPVTFTYEQLRQLATDERTATLDCTGGWYSTQKWQGVDVARLLDLAGVSEGAQSVTFEAVSGYKRRFTVAEARRYLLALDVAGRPLDHGHGFPARLVAPDQRGVNWVKWVTRIGVNESSKVWQLPLPLQ